MVVASAEGFEPAEEPVEVLPGEKTERDFFLCPITNLPGGIIGQVRGGPDWEHSVPLAGAMVVLFAGPDDDNALPVRKTETDCGDHYYFFHLEPGDYLMVVEAEGFHPEKDFVFVEPGQVVERHFLLRP